MKKKILIGSMSIFVFVGLVLFFLLNEIFEEEVIDSKDKYIAAKSGLNLRANPGKSSKIISAIPFGEKVTIDKSDGEEIFLDGRYGKWVNVKHDNKTGWLFSGFLCEFKPDSIIKYLADLYRSFNTPCPRYECTHYEVDDISIEDIIDNYIVLVIPFTDCDGDESLGVVWRYDSKQKKFFEAYNYDYHNIPHILYLDKDKYPDLVVKHGWDGMSGIDVLLGSKKGFKKIFTWWDNCGVSPSSFFMGSCGDLEFSCRSYNNKKNLMTHKYFRFNCDKRKIENFAENIIIKSRGIVTSIDWKNLSIVIKDNNDLKDALLEIPSRHKSAHKESLGGYYVEYLKKLKKGDEVSFEYEVVGDTKIVMGMDNWFH